MKTVFLAEGETHVRAALRLAIEFQGRIAVVGEADHPESLLAQVCQNPPDVILLDWNLPGLHHQRLIRILREHCPHTRVVVMSVKPEHEKAAREWDVDGFLLKQLTPEAFIAGLEMVVGGGEL